MATRTARAVWSGSLIEGSGTATMVTSGVFDEFPVTWASRAEGPDGRTSPEELLAAAHAVCYAMAFSHHLAGNGTPPDRLEVSATYTFVPGTGITGVELDVQGDVPGLDESRFAAEAEEGERKCPVSNAVRGNVEISLSTSMVQR
jgi:osmotically inducible protein OsmC